LTQLEQDLVLLLCQVFRVFKERITAIFHEIRKDFCFIRPNFTERVVHVLDDMEVIEGYFRIGEGFRNALDKR